MNNDQFFDDVRRVFGRALSQRNVDTINAIVAEANRRSISNSWLAYILATAHGESALDYAKRENMSYSAARIAQVWPRLAGRAAELAGQPTKLANAAYANRNGNGDEASGDGWTFRGAGLVQLTGRENYRKFGVENIPAQASTLPRAVDILFDGMIGGMFTGRKLSDFDVPGGFDFHGARRIVNGTFEAGRYAAWAQGYLDALERAGRVVGDAKPGDTGGATGWRRIFDMISGVRG
jgi:putative chitinase